MGADPTVGWELCQIPALLTQIPPWGPPSRAALPGRGSQVGVGHRVVLTSPPGREIRAPGRGILTPPVPDFSLPGWEHRPGPSPPPVGTQPGCPQGARSLQGAGKAPVSIPVRRADIPSDTEGTARGITPGAHRRAGGKTHIPRPHRGRSGTAGPPRAPAGTDSAPPCPSSPCGTPEPFPAPGASRRPRRQGDERGEPWPPPC